MAHINLKLHVRRGMNIDVAHTNMNKSTQPTTSMPFLKGWETTRSPGSRPYILQMTYQNLNLTCMTYVAYHMGSGK